MNKELYLKKRQELIDAAQECLNNEDMEGFEAKTKEVEELDAQWDAYATAQANLRALEGQTRVPANLASTPGMGENGLQGSGEGTNMMSGANSDLTPENAVESDEYLNAWAKYMMNNRQMSQRETDAFRMVNDADPFTHTTENTPVVVPTTVSTRIWTAAEEMYPFWADVFKTYITGNFTMIKERASTDAGWYEEDEETVDGKEEFGTFDLTGCELARNITISWKLKAMAIADFIDYIAKKMAQKMGKALGYGATHGEGKRENEKPEPLGVVTALKGESNTPQVVKYKELTYDKMVDARSKISSAYKPVIYAKSTTVWQKIAKIKDGNGLPIFVADPIAGGAYRVLGCIVKEDDSMGEGEILFGAAKAYHANINKQITVMTEEHVKKRETDYCGYGIVDGAPVDTKAFSLLEYDALAGE